MKSYEVLGSLSFLSADPSKRRACETLSNHRSQPATFLNHHAKRPSQFMQHQPATSTKLKPAASIEASNNRVIEKSLIGKVLIGGLGDPQTGATGRHRPANLVTQHLNIIKNH